MCCFTSVLSKLQPNTSLAVSCEQSHCPSCKHVPSRPGQCPPASLGLPCKQTNQSFPVTQLLAAPLLSACGRRPSEAVASRKQPANQLHACARMQHSMHSMYISHSSALSSHQCCLSHTWLIRGGSLLLWPALPAGYGVSLPRARPHRGAAGVRGRPYAPPE